MNGQRRGAALISVLFIVCIMSILIAAMLSRQQLESRRTANAINQAQADQYALGAQALAQQVLKRDLAASPDMVHNAQGWALLHQGFPIENGAIDIGIEDMQGRFNLNSLIGSGRTAKARFQALCATLGLSAAGEQVLAFIASHKGLTSLSELRSDDMLSAAELNQLRPFVAVLPDTLSNLNVNTASAQVLGAYIDGQKRDALLAALREHPALSAAQLLALHPGTAELTTKSGYFRVSVTVRYAGRTSQITSLFHYKKQGDKQILNRISAILSSS